MLIHDRIRTIMRANHLSASEFADKIGVKRSNMSHVLNGRNKPGLDFLSKIIEHYPKVNASWLLTGTAREELPVETKPIHRSGKKGSTDNQPEIERIVVFCKDGTFKEYLPSEE